MPDGASRGVRIAAWRIDFIEDKEGA